MGLSHPDNYNPGETGSSWMLDGFCCRFTHYNHGAEWFPPTHMSCRCRKKFILGNILHSLTGAAMSYGLACGLPNCRSMTSPTLTPTKAEAVTHVGRDLDDRLGSQCLSRPPRPASLNGVPAEHHMREPSGYPSRPKRGASPHSTRCDGRLQLWPVGSGGRGGALTSSSPYPYRVFPYLAGRFKGKTTTRSSRRRGRLGGADDVQLGRRSLIPGPAVFPLPLNPEEGV